MEIATTTLSLVKSGGGKGMTSDGVTRELEPKTIPYSKLVIDNGMKPTRHFKLTLLDTSPL
jgi:hypothetical protein